MVVSFFTLFVSLGLMTGTQAYVPNFLHPYAQALIKLQNYDSTVRPPGLDNPDNPVNVSVNLFVRSIEKIDHSHNEYKIQITFREEWFDSRLSFTGYDREVSTNDVQLFWKPDIFFSNEKNGHFHNIIKPNIFARVQPNGHLLLSSRISLTLQCPMALWSFPFDTQICQIRMPSYGYTTDDVLLSWKSDVDSVQVSKDLHIPGYILADTTVDTCHSKTNTGEYSCLLVNFKFYRNSFPYIIRIYIPLLVLVVSSWSSFWLPDVAVAQRLVIGSITTLTTALLIFREEEFLRLPSLTALDVWVGISAFFVFAAMFEFALLTYLASKNQRKISESIVDEEAPKSAAKKKKILWFSVPADVPTIDSISRIVFPASYALVHVAFGPILF